MKSFVPRTSFLFAMALCASISMEPQAHAAGPISLLQNGNFEAGMAFWHGEGKVVSLEGGNKVAQIDGNQLRIRGITQDYQMGALVKAEIILRARSVGYQGPGLRISVHAPGGKTVNWTKELPADGSWTDVKVDYIRTGNHNRWEFTLAAHMGTGSIQIDNVEMREPSIDLLVPASPKPDPQKPAVTPATPVGPAPMPRPNQPVPGTFVSLDQMIDAAPQTTLQKLNDPATLDAGMAELNEFFDKNVLGKPATLRFTVTRAALIENGANRLRLLAPEDSVGKNAGGVKKTWLWVYFPEENLADKNATIPEGTQVTVSGIIGHCELKNHTQPRLNVDIQKAKASDVSPGK